MVRVRTRGPLGVVAVALACVGCADNDSVESARIISIEGYTIAADDHTLTVTATVRCHSKMQVFSAEFGDEVRLLAIRNDPSCAPSEDGVTGVQTEIVLNAPLGDRTVVDVGCEFTGRPQPCTLSD